MKIVLSSFLLIMAHTLGAQPLWGIEPKSMPLQDWLAFQRPLSVTYLLANISPTGAAKGAVVASPQKKNPDYFYHWIRDAALVMEEVLNLYEQSNNAAEKQTYLSHLIDFANFSKVNQNTPNKSGGLGEPKFQADGRAFNGAWGRPQNDGPALRAIVLIRLAKHLKQTKNHELLKTLYDGDKNSSSVIRRDLEYVVDNFLATSVDLWEEVKGYHFYTQMVQRRALVAGAQFADENGNPELSKHYHTIITELDQMLEKYWDGKLRIVQATLERDGGINYKKTGLDSAVILAVLHGTSTNTEWTVDNPKIQATALAIENAFKELYPINKTTTSALGTGTILGTAVGRYPEDKYNGYHSLNQGHAWVLLINGFAEYYFTLANTYNSKGHILVTPENEAFFKDLVGNPFIESGWEVRRGEKAFSEVLNKLTEKGDAFLKRNQFHARADGMMTEQINQNLGHSQGAAHLTWSYASFLSAYSARKTVLTESLVN